MAATMAMVTMPLSFPKIMGMGPINTTPPVLTLVFSLLSLLPDDKNMVPKKISSIPIITATIPMKTRLSPFIICCLDYLKLSIILNSLLP